MGCFHKIFSNPITQVLSDVAAVATGNPEFIPAINSGETLAGGGSIGQAALSGGTALAGQELAGALGIGGGNSILNNLIGFTPSPETTGLPDIGSAFSNFTDSSGLSSLLGGTPQPTANLTSLDTNLGAVSTPDVAADATNPANFAAGGDYGAGGSPVPGAAVGPGTFTPAGGTGASSLAGGASGGGFDVASAGENTALPSASGAGGFNFDLNGNPLSNAGGVGSGIGATQSQPGFLNNLINPSQNTGTFNYDINGSPAGASSYSIPQQFSDSITSTSGGSPVISSGSGSNNMLNGLLRSGVGALFNNPNNKGYNAQINAGNQIEQLYNPFVTGGTNAQNTLNALLGENGTTAAQQAAAQANWQNTPGYQFALQQGMNAINADAAAKGQAISGNNQQAIQQYGTGLANQTYNNYLQNLENQIGTGVNAAGGVATGMAGVGNAQAGKSGAAATNQNNLVAGATNALFPSSGINLNALLGNAANTNFLPNGANNNGILNYLFG